MLQREVAGPLPVLLLLLAAAAAVVAVVARAECPLGEEHKVGQLATIFSEWTSTRTRQLFAQRNKTIPSASHLINCTRTELPHKPPLPNNREVIVVTDDNQYVDNATMAVFLQEMRDKRRTIHDVDAQEDWSRLLYKLHEPRWMDPCQRRRQRNETLLVIPLDDPTGHHAPAVIEQDRRERGNFIKAMVARRGQTLSPLAQHELDKVKAELAELDRERARLRAEERAQRARRRRSIGGGYNSKGNIVGPLMFKRPNNRFEAAKARWPSSATSKTTFSFARLSSSGSKYSHRGGPHKSRYYFVAPETSLAAPETVVAAAKRNNAPPASNNTPPGPASTPEQREAERQVKEIVRNLFHLDIKISWHITSALNTLNHGKDNLALLLKAIKEQPEATAKASGERAEQLRAGIRKWLPQIDDLVAPTSNAEEAPVTARAAGLFNITGGLYDPNQRPLWVSLVHYLEHFSVALEQMKYDQEHLLERPEQHRGELVKTVDNLIIKLLCELDLILAYDDEFQEKRQEFNKLRLIYQPATVDNMNLFYDRLLGNKLGRDRPYKMAARLESPLERAFGKLVPEKQRELLQMTARYSPELKKRLEYEQELPELKGAPARAPEHIWREIMPLDQRQLFDPKDRSFRDTIILSELNPALECIESLLLSNYV